MDVLGASRSRPVPLALSKYAKQTCSFLRSATSNASEDGISSAQSNA